MRGASAGAHATPSGSVGFRVNFPGALPPATTWRPFRAGQAGLGIQKIIPHPAHSRMDDQCAEFLESERPMLESRYACMSGLYRFLCSPPVDIRQPHIEYGVDKWLSVRRCLHVRFPHGAANQFRHRRFPSPRQSAQSLEFIRVHQKLGAPSRRHFSLLYADAHEHQCSRCSASTQEQRAVGNGDALCPKL